MCVFLPFMKVCVVIYTCQDQNQCTKTEFMCLENKKQLVLLKELKQLWNNRDSSLPWYEGEYSSSNTLMITDPVKALANPVLRLLIWLFISIRIFTLKLIFVAWCLLQPNTAIFPEKYDAENMDDDFLGKSIHLLFRLRMVVGLKLILSFLWKNVDKVRMESYEYIWMELQKLKMCKVMWKIIHLGSLLYHLRILIGTIIRRYVIVMSMKILLSSIRIGTTILK